MLRQLDFLLYSSDEVTIVRVLESPRPVIGGGSDTNSLLHEEM